MFLWTVLPNVLTTRTEPKEVSATNTSPHTSIIWGGKKSTAQQSIRPTSERAVTRA